MGDVQIVSKPGRPAETGGGPPSGLGQGLGLPRPYAASRRVRAASRSSATSGPSWRVEKLPARKLASVAPIIMPVSLPTMNQLFAESLPPAGAPCQWNMNLAADGALGPPAEGVCLRIAGACMDKLLGEMDGCAGSCTPGGRPSPT